MNDHTLHYDWTFGLRWLLVSAVGLTAGGMFGFYLFWGVAAAVQGALGETIALALGGGMFGAVMALGASLGPSQLLQSRGVRAANWIGASVIAGSLGMALAMTIVLSLLDPETMPETVAGALIGLSLGLPLGIGQWLVLARNGVQTLEWPLVSTIAFVAGMSLGLPLGGEGREWLALGVTGLVTGAITALGMVWSLRRKAVLAV